MLIKKELDCEEFIAGDVSLLRELIHPRKDRVDITYSLALARVKVGETTKWHRLKCAEVYYILSGKGKMYIEEECNFVDKGSMVYIPPNSTQRIENVGSEELVFLCIVSPPWSKECEEVLE